MRDESYPHGPKAKISTLVRSLQQIVNRDPEQEVQGIALPVLDAVLESVRDVLPNDQVVRAMRGVISVEQIESGEPVRAIDALLVAQQLDTICSTEMTPRMARTT